MITAESLLRHGRLFGAVLLILVFVLEGGAQSRRGSSSTESMGDLERPPATTSATLPADRDLAFESVLDPNIYHVGPSDIFSVNFWLANMQSVLLTVTPEGSLIVPTVGEIMVADLTLAQAKEKVLTQIRQKYFGSKATVTLVVPRRVVVTVTGNVLNPGSYTLSANNRVDKALEAANKQQRTETQEDLQTVLTTMSMRNIRIRHKDGTEARVDVKRFLATKEDQFNPYLREGDNIVVPRNDFIRNVFGVYGEVNVPGRYEYVRGDSVKDALRIAYGFTGLARADSVELSRLSMDGSSMQERMLDGAALLAGTAPDLPLEPGDRLVVRSIPDLRRDYRVQVAGEVRYPGVYPISRNRSRLADAIAAAGGFTEYASLKGAEVLRRSVTRSDIALERLESRRGGVSQEDSMYYGLETDLRIEKEVVNVDFEKLFKSGDSTQNVVLRDEDFISIPSQKKTIYVYGQVVSPGHIPFVADQPLTYYLQKAGGLTDRARQGDIKVVKAKTRQWLSPDETPVEEGDYVWVPMKPERSFSYYMNIFGQTAAVVGAAVSIVLLVIQVNK